MIKISINGLETHNEKSARDNQIKMVPSRITGKLIALRSKKSKRTAAHRGLTRLMVNAGTTKAQRELLSRACACHLVRIAPRRLHDTSESCPSALAAVRDGVADALGVDDRDAEEGGAVQWTYGQEHGPYGVRIELSERGAVAVAIPRRVSAKRLPRGLRLKP